MWDIKLKLVDTDSSVVVTRGKGVVSGRGGWGLMCSNRRCGLTVGGGPTVQYTDHASYKYTLETYMILLTNVTPINLI